MVRDRDEDRDGSIKARVQSLMRAQELAVQGDKTLDLPDRMFHLWFVRYDRNSGAEKDRILGRQGLDDRDHNELKKVW